MQGDHHLKSGDRVVVSDSNFVGRTYITTLSKPTTGYPKGSSAVAELDQEDLKILIADLQRFVIPES